MWNFLKLVVLIFAGLVTSSPALSDQLIYSHQFDQGIPYTTGAAQFDDWLSYRASLPTSDVTSITISGSRDIIGRTCSDPAMAQQIADAMLAGALGVTRGVRTLSLSCDGFTWNLGSCSNAITDSNNLELNVGPEVTMCSCSTRNYTLRPGVTGGTNNTNPNWGGIAGATCAAPAQIITVTVNVAAEPEPDTDADGVLDGDDLCPATVPNELVDAAGCSDTQVDADGDGVCDVDAAHGGPSMCVGIDNCPVDFNPDQEDGDGDNIGDACDSDTDGDGVSVDIDSCPATSSGDLVNPDSGCSIAQLCPCDGPRDGIYPWKNHGKYASCMSQAANQFLSNGLITGTEKDALMLAAGESVCGKK